MQPSLCVSGAVKCHAIRTEVPACPCMKKQVEIVWQYLFGIDTYTDISAVQKEQVLLNSEGNHRFTEALRLEAYCMAGFFFLHDGE